MDELAQAKQRIKQLEGLLKEATYALRGEIAWVTSITSGKVTTGNRNQLLERIEKALHGS